MTTVAAVRLRYSPKSYWFGLEGANLDNLEKGDRVLVETERGREVGLVIEPLIEATDDEIEALKTPLKPVVRLLNETDRERVAELKARGREAMAVFREFIAKHELDMSPVEVEFLFSGDKAVFYYTSDDRVDFRELVRDLAAHFHMRIDMRQIGARDETRMIGGLAHCGEVLCCARIGSEFDSVSIRMAKEQDLPLNPVKISGVCGRLMCCLRYEFEAYKDFKQRAPQKGTIIETPLGSATVVGLDTPREVILMRFEDGKEISIPFADLDCDRDNAGCICRCRASREAINSCASSGILLALMALDRELEYKEDVLLDAAFDSSSTYPQARRRRWDGDNGTQAQTPAQARVQTQTAGQAQTQTRTQTQTLGRTQAQTRAASQAQTQTRKTKASGRSDLFYATDEYSDVGVDTSEENVSSDAVFLRRGERKLRERSVAGASGRSAGGSAAAQGGRATTGGNQRGMIAGGSQRSATGGSQQGRGQQGMIAGGSRQGEAAAGAVTGADAGNARRQPQQQKQQPQQKQKQPQQRHSGQPEPQQQRTKKSTKQTARQTPYQQSQEKQSPDQQMPQRYQPHASPSRPRPGQNSSGLRNPQSPQRSPQQFSQQTLQQPAQQNPQQSAQQPTQQPVQQPTQQPAKRANQQFAPQSRPQHTTQDRQIRPQHAQSRPQHLSSPEQPGEGNYGRRLRRRNEGSGKSAPNGAAQENNSDE